MIKTLCIGHSSYDIYIQTDEYPKEGTRERYVHKVACGGGPAANVAYLLGKWGVSTTFAGVVGNDVFGSRIKKELETVGVDTRYMESSYENDTTISFIIVNKKNGENTIFNVADEFVKLKKFDFDFQPDFILVDGYDAYAQKTTLERFPKAISILDADRFNQETLDLCKQVNYIVCSQRFAEAASGVKIDGNDARSIVLAYSTLQKRFDNKTLIITLGSYGAVYCVDKQIKISPAIKVNAIDTTGAGDVFHGAFMYAIANGWDIEKAIKYGNIAAGLSVQIVGGRLSIPRLDDVNKIYAESTN